MQQTTDKKEEVSIIEAMQKLREYRDYYISRWKPIIAWTLLAASLGLTYSIIRKTTYIAQSSLMLDGGKNAPGGGSGLSSALQLAGQLGLIAGAGGYAVDEDKLVEILKSRRVVYTALLMKAEIGGKKDFLANHYLDMYNIRKRYEKIDYLKNFRFTTPDLEKLTFLQDSIIGLFYRNIIKKCLTIGKDTKSGIIEVKVETPSELFSKYFCEYTIDALSEFYLSNKTQKDRENLTVIQDRVDSVANALNIAENTYARWKDGSNRLVKVQGYIEEVKMRREVEILTVMYAEGTKNLEMAKFNLLLNAPVIQIIDKPILPLERNKASRILYTAVGGFLGFIMIFGYLGLRKIYSDAYRLSSRS